VNIKEHTKIMIKKICHALLSQHEFKIESIKAPVRKFWVKNYPK